MEIFGHRGAAGEAPENTIAGCLHAIERGIQRIEIDLQLSSDGEIVIVHDGTVNRTTLTKGKVDSFSATELKKLEATQFGPVWKNKQHTGIPSLEALLKATSKLKRYQLEVKPANKATMRNIALQLAARFKNPRDAKRVIITSQNSNVLKYIGEFAPHIERGFVATRVATKTRDFALANTLSCNYFCSNHSLCTSSFVRKVQKAGMHVSAWTVNEPALIKKLHKMGVDSIITDYPSMAIPLVSALER